MSADDKESVILKGLKGGVAYFIVKPVSPDDLKNVWQYAVAAKKGKSVVLEEIDKSFNEESSSSAAEQKISNSDDMKEEKRGGKDCKRKAAKKCKDNQQNQQHNNVAPKKAKVVWTNSLHNRFLLAIRHVTLESKSSLILLIINLFMFFFFSTWTLLFIVEFLFFLKFNLKGSKL